MNPSTICRPPKAQPTWHVLYHAALFETDRDKLPLRIAEAETAILNRVKEVFVTTGDHVEEDEVLEDALYGLRALQGCLVLQATVA